MDFKRDIYSEMITWKSLYSGKKALEIQGARQVGKTYVVQKFARENYKKVFYINLTQEPTRSLYKEAETMHLASSEMINKLIPDFVDGAETVIIIDEIQESSYVHRAVRPIVRDLISSLIITGSYLGKVYLSKEFFLPAGDLYPLKMYSLSFAEFLGAHGVRELYETINLYGTSTEEDYALLRVFYKLYTRIGGFPGVVELALNQASQRIIDEAIGNIIQLFLNESASYMEEMEDKAVLPLVLSGVAELLVREKQGSTDIPKDLQKLTSGDTRINRKTIQRVISWLEQSGVLLYCDRYNECSRDSATIGSRLYFSDLGIAHFFLSRAGDQSQIDGKISENFAFLNIIDLYRDQNIIQDHPAFGTYAGGEIDFILFARKQQGFYSFAFEIKAGRDSGKTATKLINDDKVDFLVYAKGDSNGGIEGNIITIPLFLLNRFSLYDFVPNISKEKDDALYRELNRLKLF